jgi:hypothetical protein
MEILCSIFAILIFHDIFQECNHGVQQDLPVNFFIVLRFHHVFLSVTKAYQLCTQRLGHPICFIACPAVGPSSVMGKLFKEGAKRKKKNFRRANIIY